MTSFSHLHTDGSLTMVDVSSKPAAKRIAVAEAVVELAPETLDLLRRSAPRLPASWRPNAPPNLFRYAIP